MQISLLFLLAMVANASNIVTTTSNGVLRTIDYRIRAPRIRPTNGFEISHGIIGVETTSTDLEFGIDASIASDTSNESSSEPDIITTTSGDVIRTIDYRIRAPRVKPTNGFEISQGVLEAGPETLSETKVITTTINGIVQVINYDIQSANFDFIGARQDQFITCFT